LGGIWALPTGILPKRNITINKAKAGLMSTRVMVKNIFMIASRS
jgi:hypothetical protein